MEDQAQDPVVVAAVDFSREVVLQEHLPQPQEHLSGLPLDSQQHSLRKVAALVLAEC